MDVKNAVNRTTYYGSSTMLSTMMNYLIFLSQFYEAEAIMILILQMRRLWQMSYLFSNLST